MGIWQQLEDRAAAGRAARVAIVGAGYVGASLLHRLRRTPGIDPVLVVNRTVDRGRAACYEVPGNHNSMIVEPHIHALAAQVAECLERAHAADAQAT